MNLSLPDLSNARTWATRPWARRSLLLGLLLGAFLLRTLGMGPMSTTMLHYDEAFNAVDSLNLLRDFRLTPFLPGNFGRESGWVYWLMPFLAALGRGLLAIRFAALTTGFLTVAAVYRLGVELVPTRPGERVGLWSMGGLGVLYWHVHLSHLGLRAGLYLMVGTLATAFAVRAYRRNRPGLWIGAGLLLGALTYTYFASVAWIAYLGALLLGLLLVDVDRRRGAALTLAITLLVALPMFVYALRYPEQVLERSTTVSAVSPGALAANGRVWLLALFRTGDPNVLFNLPGRPILDPLSGLLAIAGLGGVVVNRRWRVPGLLILGLAGATLAPSLLSNYAPHFLRGAGFVVPLSLILGMGGAAIASLVVRLGWPAESRVLPTVLLLGVGIVTARDFEGRWLPHPETFTAMEMHINRAANLLRNVTPADTPVYFSPFTPAHPVVILRGQDLAPRPTAAFNSHECWVVPNRSAAYVSLTLYEPSFYDQLSRWAEVSRLYEDQTDLAPRPRYSVFSARPLALEAEAPTARFADQFEVWLLEPLPAEVAPGATITVTLGVRAMRPPEIAPSLFLHLYTIPTPYEGGAMVGQADAQLCTSYPAHLWREEEMIIQTFHLAVPIEAESGPYQVGMGMYPFPEGARLAVALPGDAVHDYVALHQIDVLR